MQSHPKSLLVFARTLYDKTEGNINYSNLFLGFLSFSCWQLTNNGRARGPSNARKAFFYRFLCAHKEKSKESGERTRYLTSDNIKLIFIISL